MWEIVRAGGPLMWPIILCSITGAAIVLERLWTLQDKRVLPQELPERVWQLIEANQVNDKVIATLEQNSPLGRLLATGLANRHRSREMLMERLEDTGRHVVHELERFLNTLGTIAGVSPLLGLLGTVTGIIRSFNVIRRAAWATRAHSPAASPRRCAPRCSRKPAPTAVSGSRCARTPARLTSPSSPPWTCSGASGSPRSISPPSRKRRRASLERRTPRRCRNEERTAPRGRGA